MQRRGRGGGGDGEGVAGRSIIGAIIPVITTAASTINTNIPPGIDQLITQHLTIREHHHEPHRHPRDGDMMPMAVGRGHPPSSCAVSLALPGDGHLVHFDSSFSAAPFLIPASMRGGVITLGAHTGGGRGGNATSKKTTRSITVGGIEDTVATLTVGVTVSWVILSFVTVEMKITATTAMVMPLNPNVTLVVSATMRTGVTVSELTGSEQTESTTLAVTTTATGPETNVKGKRATTQLLTPSRAPTNPPMPGLAESPLVATSTLIGLWPVLSKGGNVVAGNVMGRAVAVTAGGKEEG